ncbi:MAG TPA: PRTRC system protein E [Candidatus Sulfotelmatobacter sp.]|nr:PRTRC system protein E [Candidatus Sulfotelmatobacter sp.]
MFQELMLLLAQRTLLLMLSRVGADEMRINVIPQRVKSPDADQNDALLIPLSISGTPRELDEALPAHLVEFVGAHLGLSSTLKSVKEKMDVATKAAREAARKTSATKSPTVACEVLSSAETVAAAAQPDASGLTVAPPEHLSGNLVGDAPTK